MPVDLKESNAVRNQPAQTDERNGPSKPSPGEPGGGTLRERRREPRYPCNDRAELRRLSDGGHFQVTVLDVSRSGVGVALSAALIEGARVEILLPRQVMILGEVRHCRRSGDAFHAGIQIEDVFYSKHIGNGHIHEDQLTHYLEGKGLTVQDAIALGQHLRTCRVCNARLKNASLIPKCLTL